MIHWPTLRIIKHYSRKELLRSSNSALSFFTEKKSEAHDLKTHREFLTDSYLPCAFFQTVHCCMTVQLSTERKKKVCHFVSKTVQREPHLEHIHYMIYQSPRHWCASLRIPEEIATRPRRNMGLSRSEADEINVRCAHCIKQVKWRWLCIAILKRWSLNSHQEE